MATDSSRDSEVVRLVERLANHVLQLPPSSPLPQRKLAHYLRIIGSRFAPSTAANDEFAVIQKMQRGLVKQYGDREPERHRNLSSRVDVLHQKLRSPALCSLLSHRWTLLHTLSCLANLGNPDSVSSDIFFSVSDFRPKEISDKNHSHSFLAQDDSNTSSNRNGVSGEFYNQPARSYANGNNVTLSTRGGGSSRFDADGGEKRGRSTERRENHNEITADETTLLRDLLFIFQGINGQLIKYDVDLQCHVLDLEVKISPAKRDMVLEMSELGWLYRRVSAFAERGKDLQDMGLVGQAFCFSLQEELVEYFRLIAVLESQLNSQEMTIYQEEAGGNTGGTKGLSLRRLAVWVEEPLERMRLIATLCSSVEIVRGGGLASVLHSCAKHGDLVTSQFVQTVMARTCSPIFTMIRRWVLEGELADPYQEFFVEGKPDIPGPEEQEKLWHDKYYIRKHMVPSFISSALAQRILVIGKSINFMRKCCDEKEWIKTNVKIQMEQEELTYSNLDNLTKVVLRVSDLVNERLLNLLLDRYQLKQHLSALKKFLLLGQGDFVTCLMDTIGPELSKVSNQVYRHDLTGKLESALRSSNAQFEPQEILNRVAVRLLESSLGENGWEVFSLGYEVEAPISAVIHSHSITLYSRMFHLLWRIKRSEWCLATSWKQHMTASHTRLAEDLPGYAAMLHRCNMIRGQMAHFVSNLSNYMMFEVLETSWTDLEQRLKEAKDLGSVVIAHDYYLEQVMGKSLLSPSKLELQHSINAVLDLIIQFSGLQDHLFVSAVNQHSKRRRAQLEAERRGARGQWGMTTQEDLLFSTEMKSASQEYGQRISQLNDDYNVCFSRLMDLLQQQQESGDSEALRYLMFRLDFNEFYREKKEVSV